MNILYIGPYQTIDTVGYASLDIIESLNNSTKINNLTIRPIYIGDIGSVNSFIINNLSSKRLDKFYDIIIQHAPIDMLCDTTDLCETSVAIPLFDRIIASDSYKNIFGSFTKILTDDPSYSNFVSQRYEIENVDTFSYSKIYTQNVKNIILSTEKNAIKFYAVLSDYDEDLIQKLLIAFYYGFAKNTSISLIICLNNSDNQTIKKINDLAISIKNKINYRSNIDNVSFIAKKHSMDELASLHHSCDIYIDINGSNMESKINRYIASQLNKPCITEDTVISDVMPYIQQNNIIGQYKEYYGYHNLVRSMIASINDASLFKQNLNSKKNISEVLCP